MNPLFEELYRWYAAHPEAGIPAETYRKAAFLRCADGVIGRSAASALYGDTLKNSATRLEKYAACAFAHFMEFGLQIRERDQYELKAADMGTVMHEALEKFSKKLQENGETWKTVGDDTRDRLIEECVEETMADYGNTIFQSSSRNQYRIIRVKRILKRTVWALQQQIRQGEFEPGEFEVSFSMEDSLSAINIDLSEHEKMRLRGRIDRVDLCETDDKVYVKIIDYKTGNTSLDLVALYYGLQLQLAVYLDAAVELEQKKHPGKLVEPAGVFYYHIDDPILDQEEDETDEAWGRRMLKALRMDGLVNADRKVVELLDRVLADGTTSDVIPVGKKKDGSYTGYSKVASSEQFNVIRTYTRKKVREIGEGIFSGNVKISPFQRDGATACAYCEYQGICGFDQKIQGYEYRKLKGMDTELLMKAMQETAQRDQKE
ncbi:PD-(D/E)XK nuclease family protein [Blautia sp. AF34-10]|uniref:PD-(D/E)XK nuclease family protein n=1 Tax=Blautia sp. AF34-10 TaxID=2292968 RepID=UPI002E8DED2E|nr:PD-(D/E)XK nuclease family protein [Blautia sp. AF34-10]